MRRTDCQKAHRDGQPQIQNAASPAIFHLSPDKRNIFVSGDDPAIVSATIDWQSTSIEPAFLVCGTVSRLYTSSFEPLRLGRFNDPVDLNKCRSYDICLRIFAPSFYIVRLMENSYFLPFHYCHRTWEDGAVVLREELIETTRKWKDLGFVSQCLFSLPCPDDIAVHKEDYKRLEVSKELLSTLVSLLNVATDGWVPPKDWEDIKVAHQKAFRDISHEIVAFEWSDGDDDPLQREDDLRERWPFDLKE